MSYQMSEEEIRWCDDKLASIKEPEDEYEGLFLPAEIYGNKDLTRFEVFILSLIRKFYCKEHGGCIHTNKNLASIMHCKPNTVVKAIAKLRKLGLVEDVSFDGKMRVIKYKN